MSAVGVWVRAPTRLGAVWWWLLLVPLGVAALLSVGFALSVIQRPDETRYGEAILYEQAGRLLHGQPLYQPLDRAPYTVAAYTPLYYYLVALLRDVFGAGFGPGRALSFASGFVTVALVGYATWHRTRAARPALAAGLLFLGLGLVGPVPWFAGYKEDVLGVALWLATVAVLLDRPTRWRTILAAVCAALAILTKQTMFGAALVGTVWLWHLRPQLALLFVAIVGSIVAAVAVGLEVTTHAFFANTLFANANPFSTVVLLNNLKVLLLFQTCPVLVAAGYLWPRLRTRLIGRDLLVSNWVASLIPMLALGKEGADYNYWLPFAASTAIVAMAAVWQRRERLGQAWSSFALGLNLAVALLVLGTLAVTASAVVGPPVEAKGTFERLLQEVRQTPGAVLADPLDISVLADRSILLEPLIYKLFAQAGQWDSTAVVQRICEGDVSLLVLGYPLDSSMPGGGRADDQWPRSVLDALRHRMTLQQLVATDSGPRYVYVPDPARTSCTQADASALDGDWAGAAG